MNRRVRVLFLIDSLESEAGTENQLVQLIERLNRERFEVYVACLEKGERLDRLRSAATLLVFPVDRVFSWNGWRQIRRLRRELRERRIDILHTFMVRATIAGVLAGWRSGAAVITSRRNIGHWYTRGYRRLFRLLNRLTTRVLANSEAAKRAAVEIEGIAPSQVDVLYNGVDLAQDEGPADASCVAALGISPHARMIGIVANYRPVKNLAMFLRAAAQVAAREPAAAFLLIGSGPLRDELGRLAVALGIESRVFFTDGRGSVAGYLPLLEVACLCSSAESFSNSILEYMAAGRAVVATDVGGVGEAVEHGVTGWLIPPDDDQAMAGRILSLLNDGAMRASMGARGRERCREGFDIAGAVRRQERYYEALVEGRPE